MRDDIACRGESFTAAYVDAGLSGRRSENRAQLQAMLADAEAGAFDVLVIPSIDRLGRDTRDLFNIYLRLEKAGVDIRSLRGDLDTTTPVGKLQTAIFSGLAEFESNIIGDRTRVGKAAAARKGRPNGGPRRFGFQQRDGQLMPVADEIAIVGRIFREYVGGRPQTRIAADLNFDGHRTARQALWNQAQVSQLLRDRVWIGQIVNREGVSDSHEPVIPVELFEQTQILEDERVLLERWVAAQTTPQSVALRARIVLKAGAGDRTARSRARSG